MAKPTILLLDDDRCAREVIQIYLEREGFEVLGARSVREGVHRIAELRRAMDAVILDLHLPGMGGLEACIRFRRSSVTRDIPIIVCSSRSDMRTIARCLKAGATDFVAKPFSGIQLVRTLQQYLLSALTA